MRLDDCLRQRRSIRKFTEEPVPRTTVEELLLLATLAPSASNLQPWKFIVVDDPQLVRKIKAYSPGLGGDPSAVLLFCLDTNLLPRTEEDTADKNAAVLDLAMAAENLMLAAVERGLGTCVVKSFHPALVRRILRIPDALSVEFLVTLGHPAQSRPMPRRRELSQLVRYNLQEGE